MLSQGKVKSCGESYAGSWQYYQVEDMHFEIGFSSGKFCGLREGCLQKTDLAGESQVTAGEAKTGKCQYF